MLSPAYDVPAPFPGCQRRSPRTNLFVLASLVAHGVSNRVRVRNISPSGALVEGLTLPRAGTPVTLCRADSALTGRVVWTADKRAGIRFDGHAVVADWLPSTNSGQREIDRVVELAKAERRAGLHPGTGAPLPTSARGSADYLAVATLLDQLADALAGDAYVIAQFGTRLQALDLAGQLLRSAGQSLDV